MTEMIWEDPPVPVRGGGGKNTVIPAIVETLNRLSERPGQWARIRVGARSYQRNILKRLKESGEDLSKYEFVVRNIETAEGEKKQAGIWARFVT